MEKIGAEITYPCRWLFKVIGHEETAMRRAIEHIAPADDAVVTLSNRSSNGRYQCLNLEMTVPDEAERNRIYLALKNHSQIIMVL